MSYKDSKNIFQKQVRKFRSYTAQMGILDRAHITVTFTYWYMSPQLWKEFKTSKGEVIKFEKFTDFVTDKTYGPGFKLKFFQDIIKCPDAEKELQGMEALNELVKMKEDVRRGVIASIDAMPKHGVNQFKGAEGLHSTKHNTLADWTARAKRDNPQVHQGILDGKIKTIQEIKNALGVVSPSIRCYIPKDTGKAAKVLVDKFGKDWVKNLVKELENLM